ncbi:hypothetical protein ACQ4LE_005746 [Meloidogyne hapla]|uniref:RRM domain-containing protein n=1 Tax=Meloidogyne hapla TaxID=6305 RepID=A0A1I8B4N7_MELHA
MSSTGCSPIIVIAGLKNKFSPEKLRSLINNMAQDPEIHSKPEIQAYQELIEDFQYNTGDAFAFVNMNSEEAANRVIDHLNESKLEGCDELQASLVPNTLFFGNSSVDGVKVANSDPWGRPLDGSWERKGYEFSWDEDHHYHETAGEDSFTYEQGGWYGQQGAEITGEDDFIINNEGWATDDFLFSNNVEPWGTGEGALVKKYGGESNGQQQQLYTSGIRGERDGRVYRSESRGGGQEGGRVYLELSGITLSDMIAHIKFGVSH